MATTIADLQIIVDGDASGANRAFDDANKGIDKTTTNANKLAAGAGMLGFGAIVASGFGLAISSAADFDAQISQIAAVGGPQAAAMMDQIRSTALQLGADTSFSASEAAAGMTELIKAGMPVADVVGGGADAMLDLAAATSTDVPQAASVMSASMTILGDDATQAVDRITAAANASRLDVQQWGDAIQTAGPVAKALGVSTDDLTTSIVELSNAGFSGAEAGTAMRNIITGLVNPTNKGRKALDHYGITTKDAEGNFVGLESIISQIGPSWKDMDAEQKAAFATSLVGKENMAGLITLLDGGIDTWNKNADAVANQMSAAEQADLMTDNLKGAMDALMGSIETVSIVVGTMLAPYMQLLAEKIQGVVNWFLQLSPETQKYIGIGIAVVAGLIALAGAAALASAAVGVLAAGFGLLLSPVILIVAAIALLAAGLYYAYTTNFLGFADAIDWVVEKLGEFWDKITEVWGLLTSIDWSGMWSNVKNVATETWNTISSTVTTAWNTISGAITTAITTIQGILATAWSVVQSTASAAWNFIKLAITNPMEAARVAINTAIEGIKTILTNAWTLIQTGASLAWSGIKAAIQLAIDGIRLYIETYIAVISFIITNAWTVIQAATSTAWAAISGIITSAWSAIQLAVATAMLAVSTTISGVWTAIQTVVSTAVNSVKSTIDTAFAAMRLVVATAMLAISTTLSGVWNTISTFVSTSVNAIKTTVTDAFNTTKNNVISAVSTLKQSVVDNITALKSLVTTTFNNIKTAITDALTGAKDNAIEQVTALKDDAVATITGMYNDMFNAAYDIGSAIGEGLKSGIYAIWDSVMNVAGQLADAVKNKIKGALDVFSPSKVTTYIGEMVGLGLAKGMESTIGRVGNVSDNLAMAAIPQLAFSGAGAAVAAPTTTRTTTVYLTQHNTIDASNVEELMEVTNFLNELETERVSTLGHNF